MLEEADVYSKEMKWGRNNDIYQGKEQIMPNFIMVLIISEKKENSHEYAWHMIEGNKIWFNGEMLK